MENKTQEVRSIHVGIKLEPLETYQSQNDVLPNVPVANMKSNELADSNSQLKVPDYTTVTVKIEPWTSCEDEVSPELADVYYTPHVVDQHLSHVKEELHHNNFLHLSVKEGSQDAIIHSNNHKYKHDLDWPMSVRAQGYRNLTLSIHANFSPNVNEITLPEPGTKSLLVESAVKTSTQRKATHAKDRNVEICKGLGKGTVTQGKSNLESDQYTCYTCCKKFKNYENLKKHRHLLHNAVNSYGCEICRKTFATPDYLKRHVLKHQGIKPFGCNECSKSFYEKGNLRKHTVDKHINLKPHECSECSKMFNHKSELSRHMVVHTGCLKYKCNTCFKKFSQSGYLNCHMMIHTGLTPYECSICNEKFPIKNYLTKHMIKHTTERPFECEVCKKKFKEKRGLDRHVIIHGDKKPLTCFVCGSGFSQKGHMSRHIAKYHHETCGLYEPYTQAETDETIIC